MANDGVAFESLAPEGFQFPAGKENAAVLAARVDEHYFELMDLAILRGRGFGPDDSADAPKVAIVNEQFARHYWPNQDPIGKRLRLARDKAWVQVVGLAKTTKYLFIAEPPTEAVYFPYRQQRADDMVMLVQSAGDPASLAGPLREVVHRLDRTLPIYNVRTMEEFYRMRATTIFNVLITTIGGMGLMGLGLAIVGLYGLVAYAASRRTREIGIRMAIGADHSAVLRMVLRHGLVLAAVGLVVGLAASVGAEQLMLAAFPTGDDQRDLGALLIVIPVVLAVTFLAAYVPARRAARTSPMLALRHE
jgi:predicted permease